MSLGSGHWNGRGGLAARLARLIRMSLTQRTLPHVDDLSRQLCVCTRTIRRDLDALRAGGVAVPPLRPWREEGIDDQRGHATRRIVEGRRTA
jgi:predicted DNA-binding transcriptional regulator YafY